MKTKMRDGSKVEDGRLGRLISFDDRSREYPIRAIVAAKAPRAYTWRCGIRLDQGPDGACHIAGTEVLTDVGWLDFRELTDDRLLGAINQKTHRLEFQKPIARQNLHYEGDLIISQNRSVRFAVTPDHRMYVRKWNEELRTLDSNYQFIQAGDLGWYTGLLYAPSGFEGTEINNVQIGKQLINGDDLIKFIGLFLSEGCLYFAGDGNYRVEIAAGTKSPENREERLQIIRALGFHICGYPDRFTIYSKPLFEFLAQVYQPDADKRCALTKIIPSWVRGASVEQLHLFTNAFCLGDSHTTADGKLSLYTSSEFLADGFQEIYLKLGLRTTKVQREPRDTIIVGKFVPKENCSTAYIISPWKKDTLSLERKNHLVREHYAGRVYCATVPNSILITRYKGTVLISGNCVGFGACHELAARPAEVQGLTARYAKEQVYWEAQKIDEWDGGAYPGARPFMEGTSVLAGLKILKRLGWMEEYRWAFGLDDLILGVGYNGPAIVGTLWYNGMFTPDTAGQVKPTGRVVGGHCWVVDQVIPKHEMFGALNSWGKNWGKGGRFYISFADMDKLLKEDGEAAFLLKRHSTPQPK